MNSIKKILVCGLNNSGKTTLSEELAKQLNAIHLNADYIRKNLNTDLGFTLENRIENARRIGVLADMVSNSGHIAIADFICPVEQCRNAFGVNDGDVFVVYMNTIKPEDNEYKDTGKIFTPPKFFDYEVTKFYDVKEMAKDVISELNYASVRILDRREYAI
jgi:adenylylsulfate kinase